MEDRNCAWSRIDERMAHYHDTEWGVPVHDDRLLFEHLMLEVMQCGLSWALMLKKREAFHQAFAGFDPVKLAAFTAADIEAALAVPGMIRSRRKVEAVVSNARAFLAMQAEFGSFSAWLWGFTQGKMLVYRSHAQAMPASNALSDEVSSALKARGFRYLGTVTVYSMLQACGIINDHQHDCPRFREVMRGMDVAWLD